MFLVGSSYWNLAYWNAIVEVEKIKNIENMKDLEQNMACILKKYIVTETLR